MKTRNGLTTWELRRREFLKGLGVGAGLLPVLLESQARAQGSAPLGRLIVVVKPNGVRPDTFWPTWAGGRPADGSLATATLPHVTAPLGPFRDKLSFIDNLTLVNWLRSSGNTTGDNGDAHHNWGSLLTGELPSDALSTEGGCRINEAPSGCRMAGGSVSIDCFVGAEAKKKDPALVFDSVHASLNADDLSFARRSGGTNCPSWFARDRANPPEPSAKDLFSKLFSGALPVPGAGVIDPRAKNQKRLLDFVGRDLESFGKRLGTEDRDRMRAHLETVRRREDELTRVLQSKPAACTRPAAPTFDFVAKQEANIPATSKLMMDMIVDAMKCGLTRAACYSLYDSNAYNAYFSWLSGLNGNFANRNIKLSEFPEAHLHSMAHGAGQEPATTMYRDANRWLLEQYAYLLSRLSSEPEVGGTMLDNTMVLLMDSLSSGGGHDVRRLPVILAGNTGKRVKTGRHIQLPTDTPTNGLFLAIADAAGVAPSSGIFGNPRFGKAAYGAIV